MKKHDHPHQSAETPTQPPASAEPIADTQQQPVAADQKPADAPQVVDPRVAALEAEVAAFKDKYLRLLADFDNARKRQTREREEWIRRANENLLEDLLPVLDNLELAAGKAPATADPFIDGVKMVVSQFSAALAKHGAEPFDASGTVFDPSKHEALSLIPSNEVESNVVIQQFRRGWQLGGRLVRPAQVIVSSGPTEEQSDTPTQRQNFPWLRSAITTKCSVCRAAQAPTK